MATMERKLLTKERAYLIACHRKERDGKIRDRIKAVLAYDEGYSYSEIVHILLKAYDHWGDDFKFLNS